MAATPRLEVPFRVSLAGTAGEVEQDSYEDISQCVAAFMGTPVGHRLEAPEFGVPEFLFATPEAQQLDSLTRQLETWEPRAEVSMQSYVDPRDTGTRRITVAVSPKVDVLAAAGGAVAVSGVPGGGGEPIDPGLPAGVTRNGLGTLTWNDMGYSWDQL